LKAFAKSIQTSRSFSSLEIPSEDLHEALACQMHKLLALGLRKRVASESHRCVGLDWSGVSVKALQNNCERRQATGHEAGQCGQSAPKRVHQILGPTCRFPNTWVAQPGQVPYENHLGRGSNWKLLHRSSNQHSQNT